MSASKGIRIFGVLIGISLLSTAALHISRPDLFSLQSTFPAVFTYFVLFVILFQIVTFFLETRRQTLVRQCLRAGKITYVFPDCLLQIAAGIFLTIVGAVMGGVAGVVWCCFGGTSSVSVAIQMGAWIGGTLIAIGLCYSGF